MAEVSLSTEVVRALEGGLPGGRPELVRSARNRQSVTALCVDSSGRRLFVKEYLDCGLVHGQAGRARRECAR